MYHYVAQIEGDADAKNGAIKKKETKRLEARPLWWYICRALRCCVAIDIRDYCVSVCHWVVIIRGLTCTAVVPRPPVCSSWSALRPVLIAACVLIGVRVDRRAC